MKNLILIAFLTVLKLQIIFAQDIIPFNHYDLGFTEYLEQVKTHNIEYAAEKLNINISEAAIEAAKVFSDPYISLDLIEDLETKTQTGYGFSSELGKTVDLGGERKARINLSQSENQMTIALLTDYFRKLQAEATLVYLHAMQHMQLFKVRYDSYQTMKKLYESDSIRVKLGSIMEIDAIQSKLEAGILRNELIHAIAEWKNALSDISMMTGITKVDTFFLPSSNLHDVYRDFVLDKLILEAQNNRADLLAALHNKDVSQKALVLKHKERNTDLDLKVGFSNYYISEGSSPVSTGITAGLAIPLKFSNFNKGEIKMAEFKVQQAEELFKQVELQIRVEVTQSWEFYHDYCIQVENFNSGLLEDAEKVRKGKIYSYQRGETSLLEVLNAQRTYNDIQTTYYETLFYQGASLIELEKSAGIWDISF
jgi:cobalt-zinc-cadmium efflux system outer membrane protein